MKERHPDGRGGRDPLPSDAEREFAYDRDFRLSPLDEALQEAREQNWSVVSMRQDWKRVFPGPRDGLVLPKAATAGAFA